MAMVEEHVQLYLYFIYMHALKTMSTMFSVPKVYLSQYHEIKYNYVYNTEFNFMEFIFIYNTNHIFLNI